MAWLDIERRRAETSAEFIGDPSGGHFTMAHEQLAGIIEAAFEEFAKKEKTPEQKKALADREYQSGVRYIPGEGLKISEYIKRGE